MLFIISSSFHYGKKYKIVLQVRNLFTMFIKNSKSKSTTVSTESICTEILFRQKKTFKILFKIINRGINQETLNQHKEAT